MKLPALNAAAGAALIAAAAFFAARGFRCEQKVVYRKFRGRVCYSWFRPRKLTLVDNRNRVFYYSVLAASGVAHDEPLEEYVDLFDSGHFSSFVSSQQSLKGTNTIQEMSLRDDGRIDLELEFEGRGLRRATVVDRDRCSSWHTVSLSSPNAGATKTVCSDTAALRQVSSDEADRLLRAARPAADREAFLLGRLDASKGRAAGIDFKM